MKKHILALSFGAMLFALCGSVDGEQRKLYRVGVLVPGEAWYEIVDGLRLGLKQFGFEEGKQFNLAVRNWQGNAKAAEEAARKFEQENVNLLYTTSTNSTIAARRATANIPIVFCAGTDPVVVGLVDNFANPGGRLTGVYSLTTDLTGKRLEILKEIVPKLRRVVTFYDPRRATTIESAKQAREAAQQIGIQLVERHFASIEELQAGVRALKPKEFDAYLAMAEPMAINQSQLIIDTAKAKKLPTMHNFLSEVLKGGLASYNVNLHEVGRLSAKHVQRILSGIKPQELPVEGVEKIALIINLKTANDIGLTVPPTMLARADRVIK